MLPDADDEHTRDEHASDAEPSGAEPSGADSTSDSDGRTEAPGEAPDRERAAPSREEAVAYATAFHAPVLCHDVVDRLITDPEGVYVDATLGGGGHAAALLEALAPGGRVLGVDRDPDALQAARARLADAVDAERFRAVRGNFGRLRALLEAEGVAPVDGVLLDLGVSSHQIDTPERGFSFQADGPLDMRMDPEQGLTAAAIVNRWSAGDLRQLLYDYGEERRAPRIASAIAEQRPLQTTGELARVVREAVPPPDEVKTQARVFQALRIAVNSELDMLERGLEQSTDVVRTGGRLAVISYHSLEDRRAKRYLRYGNFEGTPVRDIYGTLVAPWTEVGPTPIRADEAEIEANPRARSARLRVAERQSGGDHGPVPPPR
jgi:16S rRNA (cytosine1402-N4)-methyltransferase